EWNHAHADQQEQIKHASNKMRFHFGANLFFHRSAFGSGAVHFFFINGSYGCGGGVGRGLGVGVFLAAGGGVLVAVSVGVGVAVAVGVGVTLGVGLDVGVGEAVGVGVGLGVVPCCTSNDPLSICPLRTRQKSGPR